MNYREVKASERLPDKTDGKNVSNYVHIIHFGNIAEAGQYDYDEGEWFDDESRQLNKVEYWLEPTEPSKSAEEWFNRPENMQPGLADKFVHEAIPFDTWEDFIKYLAPYMEQYAQSKTQKP